MLFAELEVFALAGHYGGDLVGINLHLAADQLRNIIGVQNVAVVSERIALRQQERLMEGAILADVGEVRTSVEAIIAA